MKDKLIVPIEEVQPGDVVSGDGPAKKRVVTRVEREGDFVNIYLVDGRNLGPTRVGSVYHAVVIREVAR